MIVAVKHVDQLDAANNTPAQMSCPVRASSRDWEDMLERFAARINDALVMRKTNPMNFIIPDLVGIYSSDSMFSFESWMSDDKREYVVSYALRPIAIQPKHLLAEETSVPGSYSELNQDLVRVIHSELAATQPLHLFWRLHTIRAERVVVGQNYRVGLVFRRDW